MNFFCGQRLIEEREFVDLTIKISDLLRTILYRRSPISDFGIATPKFEVVGFDTVDVPPKFALVGGLVKASKTLEEEIIALLEKHEINFDMTLAEAMQNTERCERVELDPNQQSLTLPPYSITRLKVTRPNK